MAKNLVIATLIAMLVWFGSTIIWLERYHYASMLGFCGNPEATELVRRDLCLHTKQTRTSQLWHLFYGLKGH